MFNVNNNARDQRQSTIKLAGDCAEYCEIVFALLLREISGKEETCFSLSLYIYIYIYISHQTCPLVHYTQMYLIN